MQTTYTEWPEWRTLDATVPAPGEPNAYDHWSPNSAGKLQLPKPQGVKLREFCGLGNFTASFQNACGWGMAQCAQKLVSICKVKLPDPNAPPYKFVSSSGVAFNFHNSPMNFAEAEAVCSKECGHLASYSSLAEQNEVEQGLIMAVGASV
jgi:hypothetical protein